MDPFVFLGKFLIGPALAEGDPQTTSGRKQS
jgi:hypothetical protein